GGKSDGAVLLGIGDDAAIIRPHPAADWCVSSDMLLAGRHFFAHASAADIAHKVLAVNLSDMAAMGAVPRWVLLSAALPKLDEVWLQSFCDAFFSLCNEYGVSLVGGDTVRGDLVFNVTVIGEVPAGLGLRRSGASVGDDVWVSGLVGLAAAALRHLSGGCVLPPETAQDCLPCLLRPQPRVALGRALLEVAHAAQDVSDGLAQDLGHILHASGVGARIFLQDLPTLPALRRFLPPDVLARYMLAGGDDYELVFTAPAHRRAQVAEAARQSATPVSRIGSVVSGCGLEIVDADGMPFFLHEGGFDHFAD
ncbi:MAG: thiamine-phosphate kinase, partial [Neisseria sp.]|nr:thiamine-phosphate kinase [Neisseria sp.]